MGVANAIDITPGQRKELLGLLLRHLPGVAIWAFGSRVKWTSRPDSDLDLVAFSTPEQKGRVAALKEAIEESSLPFRVDLLVWDEIPENFRANIRSGYVVLVDESETKPPAPKNLAGMAISKRPFGELFAEPTRNGLTRPKAIRGSGTKMVNMGELFANPRIQNIAMDRVSLTDEEAKRSLLQTGDLLFARQSLVLEGAGKCSIYLGNCEPVTFESHVTRVRLDRNEADPRFYFYWLQSHAGRNAVRSIVEQGAGAAGIRGSDLQYLEVLWRPVEEQNAIADVLSSLDDKIELNHRMNETLEAMARAIFKSWFVNFDPVRAKASGEPSESICRRLGLTPDVLSLFPDSFQDSALGEMPEGWTASTIGTLADIVGGGTPNTKEPDFWTDGLHYWATPKDLSKLSTPVLLGTERKVTDKGLAQIGSGLLPRGTVLLSSRAPIGYRAIAEVPVAVNQGFIAMLPRAGVSRYFLLYWAEWAHDEIVSRANGSTFLEISKGSFRPIPVVIPPQNIFAAFAAVIGPIYERMVSSERESVLLTDERDTLLPQLLSGNIMAPATEVGS